MLKKIIVLFTVLSFGVFGLTACGGDKKKEESKTTESSAK